MNHLTPRERELVALGAAMGSNCAPCIEHHIPEAKKAGLSGAEIAEAIRLADAVRQVPARKVLEAAQKMLSDSPVGAEVEDNACAAAAARPEAGARCCG
jgi:AhpD family alkylhydroperoxidase